MVCICLLPRLQLILFRHYPWTFRWITMEAYMIFLVTWVMYDGLLSCRSWPSFKVQWVIYWRMIFALLRFQSKVWDHGKDIMLFLMEEVVDLTIDLWMDILVDLSTDLQVNTMETFLLALYMDILAEFRMEPSVDLLVDLQMDPLVDPWMDFLWAHTLVEGSLTVVPLQWAHRRDILRDLRFQHGI